MLANYFLGVADLLVLISTTKGSPALAVPVGKPEL